MTSFLSTYISYIPQIDPMDKNQANLILRGYTSSGSRINPCNDPLGVVFGGINCNQINPAFAYSGNPFWQTRWINVQGGDLRQYVSTGPFKLTANNPVDIIVANGVYRDTGSTSSVRAGKIHSSHLKQFYLSNFTSIPTLIDNENNILIDGYQLYQNYPNPFNPKTRIKYFLLNNEFVTLKIFDVGGREIITLVNVNQKRGTYEIEFDASRYNLSSGLYFYHLIAGNFIQTKKMILLK